VLSGPVVIVRLPLFTLQIGRSRSGNGRFRIAIPTPSVPTMPTTRPARKIRKAHGDTPRSRRSRMERSVSSVRSPCCMSHSALAST
jgi:hypothetical protein